MQARFAHLLRAGLFLFLAVYAVALAALLPVLSLWLDEIYDLIVARMSFSDLLAYIPHISGQVPLDYIVRFGSVRLFGLSAFAGRLPSAAASLAACAGVFILARRLGLRRPLLAAAIFAVLPLQLRYALEARPYELALCFTIWATMAFLRVMDRPDSVPRAVLYSLSVAAALYTFPFTLFVPAAHLLWTVTTRRWRVLLTAGLAVGLAGLVFAPYYLHAADLWRQAVVAGQLKDTIGPRVILMILHELTGSGYFGAAILFIGAALGVARSRDGLLLLVWTIVPVVCVVAADISFGYLFAIRQVIFVLAPLALLFAAGVESLAHRGGACLAAALVIAALAGNVSFFRRPREDWRAAAVLLAAEPCVVYSPADSRQLYSFFIPSLAARECSPANNRRVAFAISPYKVNNPANEVRRQLTESGFAKSAELNPVTPVIEVYERK